MGPAKALRYVVKQYNRRFIDLRDDFDGYMGKFSRKTRSALRRKLRKFETSNVDQIILLNQAGKNSHAHICESLDLFAKEVMPEFHANEPQHQVWKQKVLNREIELEEIDTTPFKERFSPNSVQLTKPEAAAATGD